MANKYEEAAARFYHSLYSTNFYRISTATQRQWTNAMKDFLNETGPSRDSG